MAHHRARPAPVPGARSVPLRPLDAILGEATIDHIKIDVEGAELAVLRGARRVLERCPRVSTLVDIHPDMGVSVEEVRALLESMGFSIHAMAVPPGSHPLPPGEVRELLALKGFPVAP